MTGKKNNKKSRKKLRKRKVQRKNKSLTKPMNHVNGWSIPFGGFDYGIRPSVASIFNPEYLNLWSRAKSIAMVYTIIPQFGVRPNLPLAGIAFEEFDVAKDFFSLLKSWMEPPCDESAVDIYFIEDMKKKVYFLIMGVNSKQLLLRTFGIDADKDYMDCGIVAYICKKFPLSKFYQGFKEIADGKEILVCPIKADPKIKELCETGKSYQMNYVEIDGELGFIKNDIRFLDKEKLIPNSPEYFIARLDERKEQPKQPTPQLPISQPNEVNIQRGNQLKRFFPVTLARLHHNKSFNEAKESLMNRYVDWQITQAACNLFARANWPENGYGKNVDMVQIYQKMRSFAQDATEDATLTFKFDSKTVEEQIQLDMQYLHSYVCPNTDKDPQQELKSKGYI